MLRSTYKFDPAPEPLAFFWGCFRGVTGLCLRYGGMKRAPLDGCRTFRIINLRVLGGFQAVR